MTRVFSILQLLRAPVLDRVPFGAVGRDILVRLTSSVKMSGDVEGLALCKVVEGLGKLARTESAESWDNVGLLVEPSSPTLVRTLLLTNDLTEDVMEEAVGEGCDLIVSYHPPLFAAIKRVTSDGWKTRILARCLENRIAVFSPHTSWDAAAGGVSDWLAEAFAGFYDPALVRPIVPSTPNSSSGEGVPAVGMGRILSTRPLTAAKCVELVKVHTGLPHVRLAAARHPNPSPTISSIALVPGSGGSLLKALMQSKPAQPVDLFLTGEMFHHDVLDAVHSGVSVILTNHSDSERGFLKVVASKLGLIFGNKLRILLSTTDRDPLTTV